MFLISLADHVVTTIGARRANWASFAAGVAIGSCCLAGGAPGWAALKRGGYGDESGRADG